jgi:hypothetical protein
MTNIVLLDHVAHRGMTVERRAGAAYGDDRRFVQVVIREFPLLAVQYPILVSKDSETGGFYCGAMLGFDEGENLFLKPGGGHEGYRPLNLQRAPFFVADEKLAIDLDSPRVNAGEGEPLFEADGRPTPFTESIKLVFGELRPGIAQTKAFLDTLLRLNLLAPMEVELSFDDGSTIRLQDLYTIDGDVLRGLPDAEVLELFRRGYLYLVHLMLVSVKQIASLATRRNDRLLNPV